MPFVEHTEELIQLDDGAHTTLERWGDAGPVMLCVHGMTSSRKSWERMALHYGNRFRAYAYDQRGHGDSADVEGPMTLHRGLLDLYGVMDSIGDRVDVLVGHSWGGTIALLGGRRFDVARVVAVDPMIRQASAQWYDEYLQELDELFALHREQRDAKVLEDYADWPEIDRKRKVHAVHRMTSEPIRRLRDENPPETWNLRKELEAYPKPALLAVAQAGEGINDPADVDYVREHGGPNIVIREFDGQGHNLHRTDFDRFIREVEDFLGAAAR